MPSNLIVFVVFALVGITLVSAGIKIIKQGQCMIIERLGRYSKALSSGLNVVIPFLDQPRSVYWIQGGVIDLNTRLDLRETVLDIPSQAVITRDNVTIKIDALLYVQIIDPIRATYEISNLPTAVGELTQTSLRNVIGEMDLDETLSSRDIINSKLKAILDEATDKWGTKVNRVELRNITPPTDIQNAMEKQMQAERERRAKVLEAEGDRQARVSRSEGLKQEKINLAEGAKEAKIRNAEGESDAVRLVAIAKKEAINQLLEGLKHPELVAKFLIASQYLEKFSDFVQKPGDKVYIPYEASTALGSLGSIKELLKNSS